jgi:hypothetical protein
VFRWVSRKGKRATDTNIIWIGNAANSYQHYQDLVRREVPSRKVVFPQIWLCRNYCRQQTGQQQQQNNNNRTTTTTTTTTTGIMDRAATSLGEVSRQTRRNVPASYVSKFSLPVLNSRNVRWRHLLRTFPVSLVLRFPLPKKKLGSRESLRAQTLTTEQCTTYQKQLVDVCTSSEPLSTGCCPAKCCLDWWHAGRLRISSTKNECPKNLSRNLS